MFRKRGPAQLARRLEALNRLRRAAAHPGTSLPGDVATALRAKTLDISGSDEDSFVHGAVREIGCDEVAGCGDSAGGLRRPAALLHLVDDDAVEDCSETAKLKRKPTHLSYRSCKSSLVCVCVAQLRGPDMRNR